MFISSRSFIRSLFFSVALLFNGIVLAGWTPDSESADAQGKADSDIAQTIATFKTKDPSLKRFFDQAHGYAVFPTVGKGGIGIGGAYGSGKVYRKGKYIGDTSLSQVTIGFQLGGQAYSEVIFFGSKGALDKFINGNFEFSAQVSAVAVTAGASADVDYSGGIAVFTATKGGLMYEASVGGQKFSYTAK